MSREIDLFIQRRSVPSVETRSFRYVSSICEQTVPYIDITSMDFF